VIISNFFPKTLNYVQYLEIDKCHRLCVETDHA